MLPFENTNTAHNPKTFRCLMMYLHLKAYTVILFGCSDHYWDPICNSCQEHERAMISSSMLCCLCLCGANYNRGSVRLSIEARILPLYSSLDLSQKEVHTQYFDNRDVTYYFCLYFFCFKTRGIECSTSHRVLTPFRSYCAFLRFQSGRVAVLISKNGWIMYFLG